MTKGSKGPCATITPPDRRVGNYRSGADGAKTFLLHHPKLQSLHKLTVLICSHHVKGITHPNRQVLR